MTHDQDGNRIQNNLTNFVASGRLVRRERLTKGIMTARKKYSLCIRNYNRCVRTRNYRRALYWGHEADRQADRVAKRVQFYINRAFA